MSDLGTSGSHDPESFRLIKYADDVTLCGRVYKNESTSPVIDEYHNVIRWTEINHMRIKQQKCQQMVVSRKIDQHDFPWTIPDVKLMDEMKLLGVIFDKKLGWKAHVNYIVKKASSRVFILRQLNPFLSIVRLVDIYYACVRSILEYCSPLFCNLKQYESNSLDVVQNRCHRIICGSSSCLCSFFVPLTYRRTLNSFKLFDALVNDSSHPLHHLMPSRLPFSNKFRIPLCSNLIIKRSFIVQMSQLSNSGFSL